MIYRGESREAATKGEGKEEERGKRGESLEENLTKCFFVRTAFGSHAPPKGPKRLTKGVSNILLLFTEFTSNSSLDDNPGACYIK